METFFAENNSKLLRYQHQVDDFSSQLAKERTIVTDLNTTISDLKGELGKAQENMNSLSSLKDTLDSQQYRTNETLRIQVKRIKFSFFDV